MIVPLFALANAGVHITGGLLSDAVTSPITIGIVAAYVVGKPLGIFLAALAGDAGAGAQDGRRRQADDHLARACSAPAPRRASASPSPS